MNNEIKLHLGCWSRYIQGFIHIDLLDMEHIDYQCNIDNLSMFENDTVSLIYSSHNFEYFDRDKAKEVLKEWRRVLKPKGILRIAVPDFDKLIEVYQNTGEINNILGPLFGKMNIKTQKEEIEIYHKTVYNFTSLVKLLNESGFEDVVKYDWRDSVHRDYDDHSQAYFPHMDKENGILISLNVEAVKA